MLTENISLYIFSILGGVLIIFSIILFLSIINNVKRIFFYVKQRRLRKPLLFLLFILNFVGFLMIFQLGYYKMYNNVVIEMDIECNSEFEVDINKIYYCNEADRLLSSYGIRLGNGNQKYVELGCFANKKVAILKPKDNLDFYKSKKKDYLNGIKRLKELQDVSNNIVKLYGYCDQPHNYYQIVEYLPGGTLAEKNWLGRLNWDNTLEIPFKKRLSMSINIADVINDLHKHIISNDTYFVMCDWSVGQFVMTDDYEIRLTDVDKVYKVKDNEFVECTYKRRLNFFGFPYYAPEEIIGKMNERYDSYKIASVFLVPLLTYQKSGNSLVDQHVDLLIHDCMEYNYYDRPSSDIILNRLINIQSLLS